MTVGQYRSPVPTPESAARTRSGEGTGQADGVAERLARYLGAGVMRAMVDPELTEVYANPDGVLRLDRRGSGREATDIRLPAERIEAFLNAVATAIGVTVGSQNPLLEAELPRHLFRGARLQGFVPPVAAAPCFVVRLPATMVYSLEQYVADGVLAAYAAGSAAPSASVDLAGAEPLDVFRAAIDARVSILIAGGTGSGKTTFANALLHAVAARCRRDRVVILEDTVELQCAAPDVLQLRTAPGVNLAALVRATLRSAPDRIIVGEVRGAEALDLLDAWATGHPGGVGTVHGETALGALERLDRMAQRAGVPSQRHLIAEAVGLVAVFRRRPHGRQLVELARVAGLGPDGQFFLQDLTRP